ncbi:MAG: tRNA dihydrouridine synthase DusB [Lachnospiraceae bacterium]|nr:tRNA dihydrouridine synthase DusB [Lachnospiraceae bacterium]
MENRKKYQIGNVVLDSPLVLGPMAGVTDGPFRRICREYGAALVSTEMVSANAVKYGNKKTFELIDILPEEHPVSMQIFGPDPETMAEAIEKLAAFPYDILDINMGCPMPKIVNNREGSALMRDPERAEAIVRACVKISDRPVTVKMRAGFNEKEINAVELAKRCEQAGVAAIAVHGRTREQYYSGEADWDIIRRVKEAVSVPVIGNGDVTTPERAAAMMRETGCDMVMIARGARGNPWLFRDTLEYLNRTGGEDGAEAGTGSNEETAGPGQQEKNICRLPQNYASSRTMEEVYHLMLRHVEMQLKEKGTHIGLCQMRKHIAWYTAGFPDSAKVRAEINGAETEESLREILAAWAGC